MMSARSARSTKLSAWRRRSSEAIGGCDLTVETTVTRDATLHGFDQDPEVAVAGEQHQMVGVGGHLHHVDGDLDVHVAAPALAPWASVYSRAGLVTSRKPL